MPMERHRTGKSDLGREAGYGARNCGHAASKPNVYYGRNNLFIAPGRPSTDHKQMVYPAKASESTLRDRFARMLELLALERKEFATTEKFSQQHVTMWLTRGKVGVAGVERFRELAAQRGVEGFTADWLNYGIGMEPRRVLDAAPVTRAGFGVDRIRGTCVRFDYLAGWSQEDSSFVDIPLVLVGNMPHLSGPSIRVLVNPTDAMNGEIERGDLVFVDTSVTEFVGQGVYVYKLGPVIEIRKFELLVNKQVLRLSGKNSYEDSIELTGPRVKGLTIGGRVVGRVGYANV